MRRRTFTAPAGLLPLCLMVAASTVHAIRAPEPGTLLPDLDARLDPGMRRAAAAALAAGTVKREGLVAAPDVAPGGDRLAAVSALEAEIGSTLTVRWSPVTGSPQMLMPRQGFLSQPDARPADTIARDFVLRHRGLFRLSESDVKSMDSSRPVPLGGGGAMIWLHQKVGGIEVLHGHVGVGVTAEGRVLHVTGADVTGDGELASRVPAHSPVEALQALALATGVELAKAPVPVAVLPDGATFRLPEFRDRPIAVTLVVAPSGWGPRLAWKTNLALTGSPAWYDVVVDDATLQPLRRSSRTAFFDTRGRVFLKHPDAGSHVIDRFIDHEDYRSDSSRSGWTAVDLTEGNNVVVREDIAGDDDGTLGAQARAIPPGPYLSFDFPWTGSPATSLDASLTSLFRNINVSHDYYYSIGFDEPSGNFQRDNFGRGGLGADPVVGDCQDGSGTDNANFQTPPDGESGRMQMFLWATGTKDGSLDLGVILHELGHGVSTRLVGGPDDVSCLLGNQARAMGEGWSDYFGASFLEDPVIGAYVGGDPVTGIRSFALDDNPPTGKDYRNFCTYAAGIPDCPPFYCEEHVNGEIWSGFLWLVREAYVAQHGTDGPRLADKLVIDALKLTPCNPSMLDARDAVILADRAQTGGVHGCRIKDAARDRWMGFSARPNGGPSDRPVAANDDWPECIRTGKLHFTREGLELGTAQPSYACLDLAQLVVIDGNAVAPLSVALTASGGDTETVTLVGTSDAAVFLGALPVVAVAFVPADGVLQAMDGESVTAVYLDPDTALPVTATASIACAPRMTVARHFVRNGTCDDDTVPGYPQLPGFIDKGESADLEIQIENHMTVAVRASVGVTTDRPDLLTILPALNVQPVVIPGAVGAVPGVLSFNVRVLGLDSIGPTDFANITVALSGALGYNAGPVGTFQVLLGRDYELRTGTPLTHDVEGELAPVGPTWSTGVLSPGSNQWTVVTCNAASGTRAYHDGLASCSGMYSNLQGNPWLSAPPLALAGAGTAAARITRVTFEHDCDLGSAGIPAFGVPALFDAEMVALMVTNDPAALDISDPFSLFTSGLALYANLPLLGIESNTTDYETQVVDPQPGQLAGVDFTQASFLTWYFLTDVTPGQCPGIPVPLDDQAEGYYVDDVRIEWESVEVVPSVTACTAGATVFSWPRIVSGTTTLCAGATIGIDASLSEATLCGPPVALEFRFLVGGLPVACMDSGGNPRVQAPDGWGTDACFDAPSRDTTYVVEARCGSTPTATDDAEISVRVLDGTVIVVATPAATCASTPASVSLDASGSSLVGCTGAPQFRFSVTPGGPLDCDGDTLPDDFESSATCDVPAGRAGDPVLVEMQCDALPGCIIVDTVTVPSISVTAQLDEVAPPPGGSYCTGGVAALTGASSVVTGCSTGQVEYRWTAGTFDSGWSPNPAVSYPVTGTATVQLEVRCSLEPACSSTDTIDITTPPGSVSLSNDATPGDCAGAPLTFTGAPAGTACRPPSRLEYRFLLDADQGGPGVPVVIPCLARTQDPAGWGQADTCDTMQAVGGGEYTVEVRCDAAPTCVIDTDAQVVTPSVSAPVGTVFGTLLVTKSASGCSAGADVVLRWPASDYMPQTFVVRRSDEPSFGGIITGYPAPILSNADALTWTDVGVACDGGGGYRGPGGGALPVDVYFYLLHLRDGCSGLPIIPDP